MSSAPMTRRAFSLSALGLLGGALVGCGSDSDDAGSDGAGTTGTLEPMEQWEPVRIKHAFGETVVDEQPARVVAAGYTEQDFLLALGVTPVALTDWYGDQPNAIWPWARTAAGSAKPPVLKLDDGFQFLDIAKYKPDLIVGVNSGMQKADYDKLSKISPTLAPASAAEGWFAPWTDMLRPIAQAVGKKEQGDKIEADIKKRFADAAAANPSFKGAKAIFLQNAVYDGSLIAYQKGLSTDFLTDLGFDVPSEIEPYVKEGEQAYIPVEKIGVLNSADVLVWGTEKDADRAALAKVPGFANLTPVKAGRSVYTGGELAGAIYFASPLSLPYVVDKLVPMLATAMKG